MAQAVEAMAAFGTLTREDLATLKDADMITFSHTNGVGEIRAIKRGAEGVWQTREAEHRIPVRSIFRVHGAHDQHRHTTAFTMWHTVRSEFDPSRGTVVDSLRAGDTLWLEWSPDGLANGHTDAAGLVGQTLYLAVERPTAGGRLRRLRFFLDANVFPRGGLSNMCR